MKKSNSFSFLTTCAVIIGVFLIVAGITGIIRYDSPQGEITRFFRELAGNTAPTTDLIFSILLIPCGIIVFLSPFVRGQGRLFTGLLLLVIIIWAARIVYFHFFRSFTGDNQFLLWFQLLLKDLIVLSGLFVIRRT